MGLLSPLCNTAVVLVSVTPVGTLRDLHLAWVGNYCRKSSLCLGIWLLAFGVGLSAAQTIYGFTIFLKSHGSGFGLTIIIFKIPKPEP